MGSQRRTLKMSTPGSWIIYRLVVTQAPSMTALRHFSRADGDKKILYSLPQFLLRTCTKNDFVSPHHCTQRLLLYELPTQPLNISQILYLLCLIGIIYKKKKNRRELVLPSCERFWRGHVFGQSPRIRPKNRRNEPENVGDIVVRRGRSRGSERFDQCRSAELH